MLNKLENKAKEDPINQAALLMKVKVQREKIEMIKNPEEFKKLINTVGILLTEIEAQLQRQSGERLFSTLSILASKNSHVNSSQILLQKIQVIGYVPINLHSLM